MGGSRSNPGCSSAGVAFESPRRRGVFVTREIPRGTLLIRIPSSIVLGGHRVVEAFADDNNTNVDSSSSPPTTTTLRPASSWLRCLAAFYEAQSDPHWTPYMQSLPQHYDSLLAWPTEQIRQLLAGTTLADEFCHTTHAREMLIERYQTQVRPFLVCRNIVPPEAPQNDTAEVEQFLQALQAVSTRCFHASNDNYQVPPTMVDDDHNGASSSGRAESSPQQPPSTPPHYVGPYFVPVVDLLNHTSIPMDRSGTLQWHRTLSRTKDTSSATASDDDDGGGGGVFVAKVGLGNVNDDPVFYYEMITERYLTRDDEVVHSYGVELSAAQCLRTFGFVDRCVMWRACHRAIVPDFGFVSSPFTPVIWKTAHIWAKCWNIIEKQRAMICCRRRKALQTQKDEDDGMWDLQVDKSRGGWLPSHVVLHAGVGNDNNGNDVNPWTDELVTVLVVPFLPEDAYQELAATSSYVDHSILKDSYLGSLVGITVTTLIKDHLQQYPPLSHTSRRKRDNDNDNNKKDDKDDAALLRALLESTTSVASPKEEEDYEEEEDDDDDDAYTKRLMCALTIRLEERRCLQALRQSAEELLGSDSEDDASDSESLELRNDPVTKRPKLNGPESS